MATSHHTQGYTDYAFKDLNHTLHEDRMYRLWYSGSTRAQGDLGNLGHILWVKGQGQWRIKYCWEKNVQGYLLT